MKHRFDVQHGRAIDAVEPAYSHEAFTYFFKFHRGEQDAIWAVLVTLGKDTYVGPILVTPRMAMPWRGWDVLCPVREEDNLGVTEVAEPTKRLARHIAGEFYGADDVVPVIVKRFIALIADIGNSSHGEVHATNLVKSR